MSRGEAKGNEYSPGKGVPFRSLKPVENLYIGAGWVLTVLFLLVGVGLLVTVPAQARPFMVEQVLAALLALAFGGFLLHAFVRKMRLAGARFSIERDPLGFIEAHSYGKSLRADGEFESLTARMSVLCRLHSIVSKGFAEVLSSYLKIYRDYEPNSVKWKASVRSLDGKVRTRFALKLADNTRAVRKPADRDLAEEEDGTDEESPDEESLEKDLTTKDKTRARAMCEHGPDG